VSGFGTCRAIFDLPGKRESVQALEESTTAAEFWNDNIRAQETLKQIAGLKYWVNEWEALHTECDELVAYLELAQEEGDEEVFQEIRSRTERLTEQLQDLEVKNMLGEQDDDKAAILSIHPGAGGTESQDWAEMLMRMYTRWIERKGFQLDVLDLQDGEEAGIKSATMEVRGPFAFGLLKAEAGVHRLVRISPFDASSRRHTSFASVFVIPEADETVEVEINPVDLRIDTYRASGAGGQHVNKTDSAIRITHLATGIVVQCQNERSQHKNKASAMKILRSRLYQLQREEAQKKQDALNAQKEEIGWGSQIRSYVMHPYNMVKDHRTQTETGNVKAVMEGDLDVFIESYLQQRKNLQN